MKLKIVNKLFIFLAGALLLSGCLPAEKTTQCGRNEAFNATRRTCVPVVGAASTNTVFINSKLPSNSYTTALNGAPVTHSIAVSDVYNYGYDSKWFLHFSGGGSNISSMVATNTLSHSFNPSFSYGAGSYVLEAVIYDEQGETLDSVSWNISINGQEAPQLVNPIPNAGSFSYASSITSSSLSADIDNDDGLDGTATWLVNGAQVSSSTFNASTTGFTTAINPQDLGVGIHTVEIKLSHLFNTSNIYDTHVWVINVVDPDLPVINMAATDPSFNHTIIAVDGIGFSAGGYLYDHDSDPQTALEPMNTKPSSGGTPGLCISVDNWDKNNDGNPDVFVRIDINGALQETVNLTSNTYCSTTLSTQVLTNSEIGVAKNLNVTTYRTGTTTMVEQMAYALNVIPKNSAPQIRISSNSDSFGCDTSSSILWTGCSLTQSVDDNLDGDYDDATDVNNVAKFAIDVTQDFETDFANPSSANDGEDFSIVHFQVQKVGAGDFQDLDGTSDYTRAGCSVSYGDSKSPITDSPTPSGAVKTYYCDLGFDAFNASGPVPSGDYIVKAYITDPGSDWSGVQGIPRDSNTVTWKVTVNEYQSAPVIQPQIFANASPGPTESFITTTTDGGGCTPSSDVLSSGTPEVEEGEYVVLHTVVKDLERDHLRVSVEMQNLAGSPPPSSGYSPVSAFQTITVTNGAPNYLYVVQSCFKVPEWANDSDSIIKTLRLYSTVIDQPDNLATQVSVNNRDVNYFQMKVRNFNPAPEFEDYSSPTENERDLAENISGGAEPTYVIPGHPFSITPPAFTDASVYDGNIVEWQWQVCVGAAASCVPSSPTPWVNIPGASSSNHPTPTLEWTPSIDLPTGTLVHLRLCLGDNGDGNPADCSKQQSRKAYTNIEVNNNTSIAGTLGGHAPSGSGIGSWYDQSNNHLYTVVASGSNFILEKKSLDQYGIWTVEHEIVIPSESTGTSYPITEVSIIGEDGSAVLIAYKVVENGVPQPRIRRIDISNGKLSFNYVGVFDSGESGVDNDMIEGQGKAGAEARSPQTIFTETANGQVDIQVIATPSSSLPADRIGLKMSDLPRTTIDLVYGIDWCASSCGTNAAIAQSLTLAINTHTELQKEYEALWTPGSDTITITGAIESDFVDISSASSNSIGGIIEQSGMWYLPFCDAGNNNKASVVTGIPLANNLAGYVPVRKFLNTKQNCSEVQMAARDTGDFALTMVADGNLHAYLLDSGVNVTSFLENAHNLNASGFALVKNHSLSVDSTGTIFTAGVSETTGGDTYLNAAVFASDLSDVSPSAWFNGATNDLTIESGIEKVKIAANNSADGGAVIALTTSSGHATIPNQAHFARITQNTGDFNEAIVFTDYQIASVASSPKVNVNSTWSGGDIWLSPMIDLTIGHADTSDSVAADNTQPSVFFGFHENNAGSAETRIGIYNASPEDISSNDVGVSGSYPAFISQ